MEKIEQVIELVAFTEKEVSALLDCNEEFKSVMFRLNTLKANEALNARFEGLDETEIERIKASERAEEIIALQEEAAEAFRVRKVLMVVSEKVEIEVEDEVSHANSLNNSIVKHGVNDKVKPVEPLVDDEVEPAEPLVDGGVEPAEPLVDDEVTETEIVLEKEVPKKTVKKV